MIPECPFQLRIFCELFYVWFSCYERLECYWSTTQNSWPFADVAGCFARVCYTLHPPRTKGEEESFWMCNGKTSDLLKIERMNIHYHRLQNGVWATRGTTTNEETQKGETRVSGTYGERNWDRSLRAHEGEWESMRKIFLCAQLGGPLQ